MTKWTAANLPDLSGRTVIVTGASAGIGLVTARELARVGAHVVLAVRDIQKGEAVASEMTGSTEVRQLDISNLASVRAYAEAWTGDIDILINNAGIMDVPLSRTADGLESILATNYIGPRLLTTLLLPHVTGRVVTVSSQLHRFGHLHLDDLNWTTREYKTGDAYAESKLMGALFSLELQRRLIAEGSSVRSMIAHPGIAPTKLAPRNPLNRLPFLINGVEDGALPTLFAATEDIPGNSYVGPGGPGGISGFPKIGRASKAARDMDAAAKLWAATEDLLVRV